MIVIGADVWGHGWVAVRLEDGAAAAVSAFPTLAELVTEVAQATVIGLDIPIGLPDPPPRRADGAARDFVGSRRSSVFAALPEPVIRRETYQEALEESRRRYGSGISAQAYALRHRILEAADLAAQDGRIREVHPEVSFAAMAGGHLTHPKRSWNGQTHRRSLLAGAGISIPEQLDGTAGSVPPDDILDAAAAAWSAHRIATGEAQTLPPDPAPDEPVIWY